MKSPSVMGISERSCYESVEAWRRIWPGDGGENADVTPRVDDGRLIAATEIAAATMAPGICTIRATVVQSGIVTGTVEAVLRVYRGAKRPAAGSHRNTQPSAELGPPVTSRRYDGQSRWSATASSHAAIGQISMPSLVFSLRDP